ncbi:Golgi-specific brefeldin A-resistance guanine nucleotide exchange factor 1-like [Bolinopsis microptera]|uniref:Golgi-specific brefeldin A-resistance guanine nucleotide exchange factor 1-like n=1 Tax=Bolinopsis microptera TaxID=2820187 RepID=UPI00307AA744
MMANPQVVPPTNGLSIVKAEMTLVVAAIRASSRWAAHTYHEECQNTLLKSFHDLKEHLAPIQYLEEVDSVTFLAPFLEVIRSENTTGPITGVALSSINKILSYNLLDVSHPNCVTGIEAIADAVTHARFVGTDPASDEVVLMKILQVLRTLMLTPIGAMLSNEAVCEVMQSCFRICFEMRLSELLRKTAEHTLVEMVRLLFVRLPGFEDDDTILGVSSSIRKALKRGLHVADTKRVKRKPRTGTRKTKLRSEKSNKGDQGEGKEDGNKEVVAECTTPTGDRPVSPKGSPTSLAPPATTPAPPVQSESNVPLDASSTTGPTDASCDATTPPVVLTMSDVTGETASTVDDGVSVIDDATSQVDSLAEQDTIGNVLVDSKSVKGEESVQEENFTNSRGVKFLQSDEEENDPSPPYGLACIRELFSFLACIINPADSHNSSEMISIGLSLLTVAVETSGSTLAKYQSLLKLCQNEVSRALYRLVQGDSLSKMVQALRICNYIVENLRVNMKLQVEKYFTILMEIVVADPSKGIYERRELALDALVHLCRLPGLIPELYLNYDCHNYCANLYEDLTKALSKNAFPVSGLHITHLLSLDALLAVVNVIALQCQEDELCGSTVPEGSDLPSFDELMKRKEFKNKLLTGSNKFNQNPSDGIKYLVQEGILKSTEPAELAHFLFTNIHLEKIQIGEFLGKKKNEHYLQKFVQSFDFRNVKIHEALRIFLETFRLPGEAQIIERIMNFFSDHWIDTAGTQYTSGFANVDSAFILSYAIIILNVDQHNQNTSIKKMDTEAFIRNQRGLNNDMDFPPEMLAEIFKSISENEIKMPDEHKGELRESYRWKVMLRRDEDAVYYPCGKTSLYNKTLFALIWGPTVAALSFVFDTALDDDVTGKAISGFHKCASVSAHYGLSDVFDNLIISLCKFTGLLATGETPEAMTVHFGSNTKSRLTARTMFQLAHTHGDILREGWKNILECILQLYKANLMPSSMYQAFDFVQGHVQIQVEERQPAKPDQGLFSSIFSLLNAESSGRGPTTQELEAQRQAKACVQECHPQKLFTDSKYLREESLTELVQWLIQLSSGPHAHAKNKTEYSEYSSAVFIELLATVILENRDRLGRLWVPVHTHLNSLISPANSNSFLVERAIVTLLRLAVRMVGRESYSCEVLHSAIMLLLLKPSVGQKNSTSICYGLFELIRASIGSDISFENWRIIFALLEMAGAGTKPPTVVVRVVEPVTESETTLVEESTAAAAAEPTEETEQDTTAAEEVVAGGEEADSGRGSPTTWLGVDDEVRLPTSLHSVPPPADISQWAIEYMDEEKSSNQLELGLHNSFFAHKPSALGKACEALSLVIRDSSIVRSDNFSLCVHAVRVFAEAYSSSCKDQDDKEHITGLIQLLDLMHTLHTRALSIFKPPNVEGQRVPLNDSSMQPIVGEVWVRCWCPLLQGIARVCCDPRKDVRQAGLTYLQRALLAHDLRALAAVEWEACFRQVIFPLLARLLEPVTADVSSLEETRMRAATLLCKAFLQHLSPLLSLPGFTDLWLDILDFMDKYIHSGNSDLLGEAIPENLKNMLLVMSNAAVFDVDNNYMMERNRLNNEQHVSQIQGNERTLWLTTWERIDKFLPALKTELFPTPPQQTQIEPAVNASAGQEPDMMKKNTKSEQKNADLNSRTVISETENQLNAPPPATTQPGSTTVTIEDQPPLPPLAKFAPLPQSANEAAAVSSPTNIAPPPLPVTSVALPPLPSDLQNLMSSIPQLVPGKAIRPVEVQTQSPSVTRSSGAPVNLQPLSSYLTK